MLRIKSLGIKEKKVKIKGSHKSGLRQAVVFFVFSKPTLKKTCLKMSFYKVLIAISQDDERSKNENGIPILFKSMRTRSRAEGGGHQWLGATIKI